MPLALTEKVAVWPARMDWLAGCALINGAAALPVPCHPTPKTWRSCWFTKETLPEVSPVAEGAKLAVNVTLAPGFTVTGRATPPTVRPAPEALTPEIVTAEVPELLSVKL